LLANMNCVFARCVFSLVFVLSLISENVVGFIYKLGLVLLELEVYILNTLY